MTKYIYDLWNRFRFVDSVFLNTYIILDLPNATLEYRARVHKTSPARVLRDLFTPQCRSKIRLLHKAIVEKGLQNYPSNITICRWYTLHDGRKYPHKFQLNVISSRLVFFRPAVEFFMNCISTMYVIMTDIASRRNIKIKDYSFIRVIQNVDDMVLWFSVRLLNLKEVDHASDLI